MVIWDTIRNPLFCSAAVCAAVICCMGVPVRNRHPFRSAVPLRTVIFMEGRIVSDPVKSAERGTYSARFCPFFVRAENGISSTCTGSISVSIPSGMAEAYHPGNLYSMSRKTGTLVCETGACAALYGKSGAAGVFSVQRSYPLGFGSSISGRAACLRAFCRLRFRCLMYAWGAAGGLFLALFSGVREYVDPGTAEAFKKAGLAYILALSGMHISICSGAAAAAGSFLCGKRTVPLFRILAVLLFVWFAGFSPSLLRAVLCCVIMTAASLCGVMNLNMLLVLSAAFLCHVCIAPQDCRSAAFLLSYSALGGILLLSESIHRRLSRIFPRPLSLEIAVSTAAQTVTAPVTLRLFGAFMPGGIPASAAASPLIAVFMYAGMFLTVLSLLLPGFAVPAGTAMNALYTVIKAVVTAFSNVPCVLMHHIL